MKKYISISLMTLASLVLILLAAVPHHHHKGLICFTMEIFEGNDTVNNEHTEHDKSANDGDELCISEYEYTSSRIDEQKCKIAACQNHDFAHLFPIILLFADIISINTDTQASDMMYSDHTILYKSADTNLYNGLRAPPYSVC